MIRIVSGTGTILITRSMSSPLKRWVSDMANLSLAKECLMHAAHSRMMWLGMVKAKHKPHWDHYRGWLMDARAFRLGQEFKALGCRGVDRAGNVGEL